MTNNKNNPEPDNAHDQRKDPRIQLKDSLELYNSHTGQKIGQMVNLSENGFMLSSQEPVPEGMILQCQITIKKDGQDGTTIHLGAESLWQREGCSTTQFWSGFQVLDISDEDQQRVVELLEEYPRDH